MRLSVQIPAESGGQTQIIEDRRPQVERQVADFLERVVGEIHGVGEVRARRVIRSTPRQALKADLQRGQVLADLVVQLPRDGAAFFFLSAEQLRGKLLKSLIGFGEFRFKGLDLGDVAGDALIGGQFSTAIEQRTRRPLEPDRGAVAAHAGKFEVRVRWSARDWERVSASRAAESPPRSSGIRRPISWSIERPAKRHAASLTKLRVISGSRRMMSSL